MADEVCQRVLNLLLKADERNLSVNDVCKQENFKNYVANEVFHVVPDVCK